MRKVCWKKTGNNQYRKIKNYVICNMDQIHFKVMSISR